MCVGGCQNYGALLGPLNTRCRTMLRIQKGTIILTTTHVMFCRALLFGVFLGVLLFGNSCIGIWNLGKGNLPRLIGLSDKDYEGPIGPMN